MVAATGSRSVARAIRLRGELRLPSDKSIAHRALIANALSGGPANVSVHAPGDDVLSTVRCLRALGIEVEETQDGFVMRGEFDQPVEPLDCGNSGTTMRLLAGALAGLPLTALLDGDASLRRRPMARVAEPLAAMGATVETSNGRAPLRVSGRRPLRGLEHRLSVASAQLLTAIALAGLAAEGETRIVSPGPTRDHTERLLAWMGTRIQRDDRMTVLSGPGRLQPRSMVVPGDTSAATPWLVAASIHPDAEVRLMGVGLNPTRLAAVEALREMGAVIEIAEAGLEGREPVGDITVRSAEGLRAISVGGDQVAALIDELPALAIAMASADGVSELRDAGELRVKESDRIAAMAAGLHAIGARVEELPDGWRISRGRPRDAAIVTHSDHRLAIAFAVAGLAGAAGEVRVDDPGCASVSYPTFWEHLAAVSA